MNASRSVSFVRGFAALALAFTLPACLGESVVGGVFDARAEPVDDLPVPDATPDAPPDALPDAPPDLPPDLPPDDAPCRCAIPNAEARCGDGGACELVRCAEGWSNCNDSLTDGCETNIRTDVLHCGLCGAVCRATPHATVACVMGACAVGRCTAGYVDCNRAPADGCEVDTRRDPQHCGGCGMRCAAPPNAVATCEAGACAFACAPGFADCDGDAANGCEVNTADSLLHCGACNNNCASATNAMARCTAGACEFDTCNAGFGNCDGSAANGCEVTFASDARHCGRCGNACPTGQSCVAGACVPPCPAGQTRCGSACVALANDPAHCGRCGNACPAGQLCGNGACVPTCMPPQQSCGSSCAALATDRLHCGVCNRRCPDAESCVGGACVLVCPSGQTVCGGRCVDTAADASHCGGCGRACPTGEACRAGDCIPTCPAGQVLCGRRCVTLQRDPDHCGACNRVCASGCVMGACARPEDVALSTDATCALYTSGRVACVGRAAGVLPTAGSGFNRAFTPRQITDSINRPLENVVELAGGGNRMCARVAGGGVVCFANGNYPGVVSGITNAVSVSGREDTFVAADAMGRVYTWTGIPQGATAALTPVAGITGAVEVAAGAGFRCLRRADGTVACWGSNDRGQLGDGSTTNRTAPVAVTALTGVVDLALGRAHACALRSNGAVSCWGANERGQLGDGSTTQRPTPVTVTGLAGVRRLRAGLDHTCALLGDGTLRCWGDNQFAQLGNGLTEPSRSAPVTVAGVRDAVSFNAYEHHTCAVGATGNVQCWGDNPWGETGGGTESRAAPARVNGLTGVTSAVGFAPFTSTRNTQSDWVKCALQSDGRVFCWSGRDSFGPALGDGSMAPRPTPGPVTGLTDATQITAGANFACALRRTGRVVCWGRNVEGQLGDGSTTARATPVEVMGLTDVAEVHAGFSHTCARTTTNRVACWGYNYDGQLGRGGTGNASTPAFVPALDGARQLTVGSVHSCALLASGEVRCWGNNGSRQMGNGLTTHAFTPTAVLRTGSTVAAPLPLVGIAAITARHHTTYARPTMGTPAAWYWGPSGTSVVNLYAAADPDSSVLSRDFGALGFGVSCVVTPAGAMTCTGSNEFGQAGIGAAPVAASRSGVVMGTWQRLEQRADGAPCAINDRGELHCWGATRYGFLAAAGLDSVTRTPATLNFF